MPACRNVTLSNPLLSPSQIRFRLELARRRTRTYPLDSMDFIMIDMARPEGRHRQAYQCAGDLTGRLLEFLSHADGLLALSDLPRPEWMYFDEGATSRCGVEGSAANVTLRFPDGKQKVLRFTPLCYNTSCLSLFDTPIVFGGAEQAPG
ncbi:MAG: hypothetical protein FJ225_05630 [Lentisphaerae bacterium]|nr:hypothetical protein [Lentisphaerota bacterium]